MKIIPILNKRGNLTLYIYTYASYEIDSFISILKHSNIIAINGQIRKDRLGKRTIRFIINREEIHKLELFLNLTFEGNGEDTRVIFDTHSNFNGDRSFSYKCSRIDTPPNTCIPFKAKNDEEALFKCSIIAGQRNWLGGKESKGVC